MPFGSLWLPVLVSAVVVFVVSAVLHMVLRYHLADYRKLPNEDAVGEAMRKGGVAPGLYMTPYCQWSEMKDPGMVKKFTDGPVAFVAVMPSGQPRMGKSLVQWFAFCVLASFVTAYIARHTLSVGTAGMTVLRITGSVSFCIYGMGYLIDPIWKAVPWSNTIRSLLDAVVYSLVTAAAFMLLWPSS